MVCGSRFKVPWEQESVAEKQKAISLNRVHHVPWPSTQWPDSQSCIPNTESFCHLLLRYGLSCWPSVAWLLPQSAELWSRLNNHGTAGSETNPNHFSLPGVHGVLHKDQQKCLQKPWVNCNESLQTTALYKASQYSHRFHTTLPRVIIFYQHQKCAWKIPSFFHLLILLLCYIFPIQWWHGKLSIYLKECLHSNIGWKLSS